MYILEPYDDLLKDILRSGIRKNNRTGVDTIAIHGTQSRYDISQFFPLPTRRKYPYKSIFGELLWMLRGETNVNILNDVYGSKIWNPWKDEKFEKENGYEQGNLGPVYGHQIRKFNQIYDDVDCGECGRGDQLMRMVRLLKTEPWRRDILWSLWNPLQIEYMRLPPCHYAFQVLTRPSPSGEMYLDGILTQRSGDVPIGVPANIIFYSALIYLLSDECGFKPGHLIHHIGDAHIYVNQIDGVEKYLSSRLKPDSPTLKINKKMIKNNNFNPDLNVNDFNISNYCPLEAISIPVTV